jgi:hypothetical protein
VKYLVDTEVRVFSLKRSGTNAISRWLYTIFAKEYGDERGIYIPNSNFSLLKDGFKEILKLTMLIERGEKIKYLINSTENYNLIMAGCADNDLEHPYNKLKNIYLSNAGKEEFSRNIFNIIVLRSPHNHLASIFGIVGSDSFRSSQQNFATMILEFEHIWVVQAKEYLCETNYIRNKVPILYDEWFTSKDYRGEICSILNIALPDDDRLPEMGVKSSFDWKPENPSTMKVLDRWKVYRDNEIFRSILRDQELQRLYETIFDEKLCV